MPKVVCRVAYCAHNLGGEICNAAVIEINEDDCFGSEQTDCSTFIPREFSGSLLSLENVNYSGLVAQAFSGNYETSPQVRCLMSSCCFNDGQEHCRAEDVEIFSSSAHSTPETLCSTFRECRY
ncbi:MAG: DUF1540 domain-containing protein [Dethiobacter sp.]|jgi:hypothetical protein|nr:DUF1540 domain-containing protein [Dethiobacter sp.]